MFYLFLQNQNSDDVNVKKRIPCPLDPKQLVKIFNRPLFSDTDKPVNESLAFI